MPSRADSSHDAEARFSGMILAADRPRAAALALGALIMGARRQ